MSGITICECNLFSEEREDGELVPHISMDQYLAAISYAAVFLIWHPVQPTAAKELHSDYNLCSVGQSW